MKAPILSVMILSATLVALAGAGGCDLHDGFFDDTECSFGALANVQGTWTLRGEATDLSGCEGMSRVSIGPGVFAVRQEGALIDLAEPRPGFALQGGAVSSRCVQFTTLETRGASTTRISFTGRASGASILGDWDATLHQDCFVSGTFSVTIAP